MKNMETKKRVVMVDFWSVCDENGKPIGHGGKVGNEYYGYIRDDYNVVQYVNDSMLQHLDNPKKTAFSNSLKHNYSKWKRVLTNFRCLNEVYRKEADSTIWFYVPDIYLFLFILLMPKGKRRIIVNVYEEYIGSKAKHWIFKQALKKIDKVFVTNKLLLKSIPEGILIPDYAYNEEVYSKYQSPEKKEQAVCLGTMNEKKQLVEAVEVFSKNGYPLYIAGQFSSKDKYAQLCNMKSNNISIENRFVDFDEYYRLLASSKYCLIPYDAEFYKNRTSGVIQECLFCNTIPITHKDILAFANIEGMGYTDIEELSEIDLRLPDINEFQISYAAERDRFYRYEVIKRKIVEAFVGE